MFVCKNCGQTYPVYSNFCTKCGNNVLEEVADAPVAPAYEAPAAPAYEAPVAPAYEAPVAPAYEAPVAPQYEAPVAPAAPQYEAPVAPAYNTPVNNPAYGAPAGGPAYGAPYGNPAPYTAAPTPAPASGGSKVKGIVGMALAISGAVFAFISFCYACMGIDYMDSWYGSYLAEEYGATGFVLGLMALGMAIAGKILAGKAMDEGFVSGISRTGKIVGLIAIICAGIVTFLSFIPMVD